MPTRLPLSKVLLTACVLALMTPFATAAPKDDLQVVLEVKLLSIADGCYGGRLGVDFEGGSDEQSIQRLAVAEWLRSAAERPTKAGFLNDEQVNQLLTQVQGDTRTHVILSPKMTVLDRQTGVVDTFHTTDYLTGVEVKSNGRDLTFTPKQEQVKVGTCITATPTVSEDRRTVLVDLKIDKSDVVTPVLQRLIVTPMAGKDGEEESFRQVIQCPTTANQCLRTMVGIPNDGTVLLGGWDESTEVKTESCPPVLSKIPYLNRLFKNVGYGREKQHVFVLVTPHLIVQEKANEVTTAAPACPRCDKNVKACPACYEEADAGASPAKPQVSTSHQEKALAELLKAYDEACAAGHEVEAKKYAKAALIIDPTCFRRK